MRHLGKKSSVTANCQLSQGDSVSLADGEAIWLLPDKYKHFVQFSDIVVNIPHDTESATTSRKRSVDEIVERSTEPISKRHSAASTMSTDSVTLSDEMSHDEEQDTDTKHLELVRELLYAFHRLQY